MSIQPLTSTIYCYMIQHCESWTLSDFLIDIFEMQSMTVWLWHREISTHTLAERSACIRTCQFSARCDDAGCMTTKAVLSLMSIAAHQTLLTGSHSPFSFERTLEVKPVLCVLWQKCLWKQKGHWVVFKAAFTYMICLQSNQWMMHKQISRDFSWQNSYGTAVWMYFSLSLTLPPLRFLSVLNILRFVLYYDEGAGVPFIIENCSDDTLNEGWAQWYRFDTDAWYSQKLYFRYQYKI